MRFLTFVKEYVQEHPHLTFKEAIKSDEVKCLFHKAGKATYCKDDENKGVVVNVNCSGKEEEEQPKKSTPSYYTAPRPPLPPRAYDKPGYDEAPPEQPRMPPMQRRIPVGQRQEQEERNKKRDDKVDDLNDKVDDLQTNISDLEEELSAYSALTGTTFPEPFDDVEQPEAARERARARAGNDDAGSTVVPEDNFSQFSQAESERLRRQDMDQMLDDVERAFADGILTAEERNRILDQMLPPPPQNRPPPLFGPPGIPPPPPGQPVNVVEQDIKSEVNGLGLKWQDIVAKHKKKKLGPRAILRSYTAPRSTPGPREYLPPKPEFRRHTNDREREAFLKLLDAVRMIL